MLCLSPGSKTKSKTKDEEEQDKGSVSDSGTVESTKEKGNFKAEKESYRVKHRGPRKKDNEKDTNKYGLIIKHGHLHLGVLYVMPRIFIKYCELNIVFQR